MYYRIGRLDFHSDTFAQYEYFHKCLEEGHSEIFPNYHFIQLFGLRNCNFLQNWVGDFLIVA
jgi:hypothetical protein